MNKINMKIKIFKEINEKIRIVKRISVSFGNSSW